jgi:hypothetical protein
MRRTSPEHSLTATTFSTLAPISTMSSGAMSTPEASGLL